MRVSHKEIRQTEVEVIDDILCNKCGGSCRYYGNDHGLVEQVIEGGYGSKLGDMVTYRFSLCEGCLATLFATFKHPVEVLDLNL